MESPAPYSTQNNLQLTRVAKSIAYVMTTDVYYNAICTTSYSTVHVCNHQKHNSVQKRLPCSLKSYSKCHYSSIPLYSSWFLALTLSFFTLTVTGISGSQLLSAHSSKCQGTACPGLNSVKSHVHSNTEAGLPSSTQHSQETEFMRAATFSWLLWCKSHKIWHGISFFNKFLIILWQGNASSLQLPSSTECLLRSSKSAQTSV